jgi:universal stress protein A
MLPFKKILCPTDFSEASYKALGAADEIAKHFSAEILLVHVVEPLVTVPAGPTAFNVAEYQIQLVGSAKIGLEAVAKERFSKGVKVEQTVLEGGPAYQIVHLAEREQVDLIVIATHGQTGWRHLLFGSVAEKVVRLASCAVLTVQVPHEQKNQARKEA